MLVYLLLFPEFIFADCELQLYFQNIGCCCYLLIIQRNQSFANRRSRLKFSADDR